MKKRSTRSCLVKSIAKVPFKIGVIVLKISRAFVKDHWRKIALLLMLPVFWLHIEKTGAMQESGFFGLEVSTKNLRPSVPRFCVAGQTEFLPNLSLVEQLREQTEQANNLKNQVLQIAQFQGQSQQLLKEHLEAIAQWSNSHEQLFQEFLDGVCQELRRTRRSVERNFENMAKEVSRVRRLGIFNCLRRSGLNMPLARLQNAIDRLGASTIVQEAILADARDRLDRSAHFREAKTIECAMLAAKAATLTVALCHGGVNQGVEDSSQGNVLAQAQEATGLVAPSLQVKDLTSSVGPVLTPDLLGN